MRWSRGLVLLGCLVVGAPALAQTPSISNVTGTFTHGQTITITATNIGSGAAPHCWDDFSGATLNAAAHLSPGCNWQDDVNEHDPTICNTRLRPNSVHTRVLCALWDDNDSLMNGTSNVRLDGTFERVWLDHWYYLDPSAGSNFIDGQLNIKIFRFHGAGGGVPNAYLSTQYGPASSGDTFCRVADESSVVQSGSCAPSTLAYNGNISNNEYTGTQFWTNWRHYQVCAQISNSTAEDGTWILYIDGARRYNRPGNINLTPSGWTDPWAMLYLGNYIRSEPNGFDGTITAYTEAPLIGNGCARVELSNHATYTSATLRETCPTITWSGSTITCELNRGGHLADASVYVHVCTDADVCSAGYGPITLGGGGPGASARRRPRRAAAPIVSELLWKLVA